MTRVQVIAGGDGEQHLALRPQRMKVTAREKELHRRLFNQLGSVFHSFVCAFRLQVGPTDEFSLGLILMSDDKQTLYVQKIVGVSQEDPSLCHNILAAYDLLTTLKVSPAIAHPGLTAEFLHAVTIICCGLSLDVIGKKLRSGKEFN